MWRKYTAVAHHCPWCKGRPHEKKCEPFPGLKEDQYSFESSLETNQFVLDEDKEEVLQKIIRNHKKLNIANLIDKKLL